MAIPFSIPSEEDADESYRQLDFLLEHLIVTLREVIMYRRTQANYAPNIVRSRTIPTTPSTPNHQPQPEQTITPTETVLPTIPEEESETRLPLPDVVPQAEVSFHRYPKHSHRTSTDQQLHWVQVGAELRRIADNFHDTNACTDDQMEESLTSENQKPSTSLSNFFSIFRPQFGWTSLALLLGWNLITRTR